MLAFYLLFYISDLGLYLYYNFLILGGQVFVFVVFEILC